MQTVNFVKNALLIFEKRLYFRVNDNIPTDGSWVLRDKLRFMREIYEPFALQKKKPGALRLPGGSVFFSFQFSGQRHDKMAHRYYHQPNHFATMPG